MIEAKLTRITRDGSHMLDELFSIYVKEMMAYVEIGSATTPTPNSEDRHAIYFTSDTHWPYFISSNGAIAGFCFIRRYPQDPETYDIDQFFILDKYKRLGLGRETLKYLVELHPGNWLVRVLKRNTSALSFWKNSISAIVDENFTTASGLDNNTEMNFIRFDSRNF